MAELHCYVQIKPGSDRLFGDRDRLQKVNVRVIQTERLTNASFGLLTQGSRISRLLHPCLGCLSGRGRRRSVGYLPDQVFDGLGRTSLRCRDRKVCDELLPV